MKRFAVPLEQVDHKDYYEQEILLQPQTSLNANSLNSANTSNTPLDFHIYRYADKKCCGLIVEFDVSESGGVSSVNCTPSPFFVSYIEFRDSGNKLIETLYNFNLYKNLAMLDYNQQKQIFPKHGINPDTWKPNENCTLQPNQKQQFFLYILGDVFTSNRNIYMEWKDYLLVRLYLVNSVESGSGTLTLNQCQLRIRTQQDDADLMEHKRNSHLTHKFNFIDYLSITSQPAQTISSALTQIRLQNFVGHNVCTDVILRNGVSVTNGQYRNFISLGRQAQLNYYDRANSPLLGGSFLDAEESRLLLAPRHVASTFYKYNPVYPIYFGKLNLAQMFGRMEGVMYEDSYNQIGIQSSPDSFQAPVLTVTTTGTPASGFYSLRWTSPVTGRVCDTAPLLWSSSASVIQTALQALPNWDDSNINTVTVSGNIGSSPTFTFAGNWYGSEFAYGITAQSLQVVGSTVSTSLGAWSTFSTALTTAPNNGFNSASYRVDIYSSIFRAMTIDSQGNIGVMDLTDSMKMNSRVM